MKLTYNTKLIKKACKTAGLLETNKPKKKEKKNARQTDGSTTKRIR